MDRLRGILESLCTSCVHPEGKFPLAGASGGRWRGARPRCSKVVLGTFFSPERSLLLIWSLGSQAAVLLPPLDRTPPSQGERMAQSYKGPGRPSWGQAGRPSSSSPPHPAPSAPSSEHTRTPVHTACRLHTCRRPQGPPALSRARPRPPAHTAAPSSPQAGPLETAAPLGVSEAPISPGSELRLSLWLNRVAHAVRLGGAEPRPHHSTCPSATSTGTR